MNRITIKKLVLVSNSKEPAIVDFVPGFNAITGASDTGKSLIFQCINYALGSSKKPKNPKPEGVGYTDVYLELSVNSNDCTIHRSTLGGDATLYDREFNKIEGSGDGNVIPIYHKSKDNLSLFFLKKIGLEGKLLKKSQAGEKSSFTFNILRKIIAISEEDIIGEESPISIMNERNETIAKSAARLLFIGTDYSNMPVYDTPPVHKAKIEAKISILEELIAAKENTSSEENLEKENIEEQLGKLNQSIEQYMNTLSSKQNELEALLVKRKNAWNEALSSESKIEHLDEVIGRFSLLKCLIPSSSGVHCDIGQSRYQHKGATLWAKYYMHAPRRQRRVVERYKIAKRA